MSDTLMTIIGIFIAVILMFIFPLLEFAQRSDEIAQTTIQVAVSSFVEASTSSGKITKHEYDKMVQKIYSTGNSFDVQMEVQIIDDNPRRTTTTADSKVLGEYKYYSVYNNAIMEYLDRGEDYELKDDDYLTVTVKCTSETLATQLKNVFYRITGRETYVLGTSVGSIVLNDNTDPPYERVSLLNLLPDPEPPSEDLPEPEPEPEPQPDPGDTVTVTYIINPDLLGAYRNRLGPKGREDLDNVLAGCNNWQVKQIGGMTEYTVSGIQRGDQFMVHTLNEYGFTVTPPGILAQFSYVRPQIFTGDSSCEDYYENGRFWLVVGGNDNKWLPGYGDDIKSGRMVESTKTYQVNEDTILLNRIRAGWGKPVIYIYPEEETEVNVKLAKSECLTVSYPRYGANGWNVVAKPDGTLTDTKTGRELYCLYYESNNTLDKDAYKDGFIVKGEDMQSFLEEKLAILGLNEREAEEFIIYWLPKLEENEYTFIRFAESEYINSEMPLEINPAPDNLIRVLMEFKAIDKPFEVEEQKLTTPSRDGYTVVEWGATQL